MKTYFVQMGFMPFLQSMSPGVAALLVLLLGFCVAILVRLLASRILEAARFNTLCDKIGVSEFLRKGDVNYSPARLAAVIAYWLTLLSAILWALHLIGVRLVATLVNRVEAALPTYIAAVCIVAFGYVVVSFCANVLRTIARNAAFVYADLLASVVKWGGLFLVLAIAVGQLGLEFKLISAAFQIILAAAAFGLALAFGLGCKDIARDSMQRFLHNLRERHRSTESDLEG
ncbi:MAG: hypothetical protein QME66_06250 [Candidatus Eisenbacteria bacterium]|nr:hypothetical protein [Candidatus Eisenbacteria bacterium]